MRHIDDDERRARLGVRHGLAPGCGARDPAGAATAVVALHGTDLPSVYLSVRARAHGVSRADVDAVIVCTPNGQHEEPALLAAAAGKHILVEKPLEVTLDRIDRMAAAYILQGALDRLKALGTTPR